VVPVTPPEGHKPAYYKYMALLPEGVARDKVKQRLKNEFKISLTGEVYAAAGHKQPLWTKFPQYLAAPVEPLPVTEMVARRQICLPIYPDLSDEAAAYVAEKLLKVVGDEM